MMDEDQVIVTSHSEVTNGFDVTTSKKLENLHEKKHGEEVLMTSHPELTNGFDPTTSKKLKNLHEKVNKVKIDESQVEAHEASPQFQERNDKTGSILPQHDSGFFGQEISPGPYFDKFDSLEVLVNGGEGPEPFGSFDESPLKPPILDNLKQFGFTKWTPIQKYGIPSVINGRDVFMISQSGSGKTMAYLVPIVNCLLDHLPEKERGGYRIEPLALILCPTREQAQQTFHYLKKLANRTQIKCMLVEPNINYALQIKDFLNGCHILIATPGRLMHFLKQGSILMESLRFLVVDGADFMLYNMECFGEIEHIICENIHDMENFQTLLITTTFPPRGKLPSILKKPFFIACGAVNAIPLEISQTFTKCIGFKQKLYNLVSLLKINYPVKDQGKFEINHLTIIFTNNVKCIYFLYDSLHFFKSLIVPLRSELEFNVRSKNINEFKSGLKPIMISTFFIMKGLNFPNLKYVINFDLPSSIDTFINIGGLTGRLGNEGHVTSFYENRDQEIMNQILNMNKTNQLGRSASNFFYELFSNPSDFMDTTMTQRPTEAKRDAEAFKQGRLYRPAFPNTVTPRSSCQAPNSLNSPSLIAPRRVHFAPVQGTSGHRGHPVDRAKISSIHGSFSPRGGFSNSSSFHGNLGERAHLVDPAIISTSICGQITTSMNPSLNGSLGHRGTPINPNEKSPGDFSQRGHRINSVNNAIVRSSQSGPIGSFNGRVFGRVFPATNYGRIPHSNLRLKNPSIRGLTTKPLLKPMEFHSPLAFIPAKDDPNVDEEGDEILSLPPKPKKPVWFPPPDFFDRPPDVYGMWTISPPELFVEPGEGIVASSSRGRAALLRYSARGGVLRSTMKPRRYYPRKDICEL